MYYYKLRFYLNLRCLLCNYIYVVLFFIYKFALLFFQNLGLVILEDDVNVLVVSVRERVYYLNRMESESELQKMIEV